ncbi:WD40/YVTN/BNR-like repeat-containing protein [Mucilaginibacter ximonensis]|uniref:WD40/YVTN/BNR-like repeat-containing protein n=1 Tax=Mucilaginibacter ximonensis TaxID=538021 RepID=A0ABW5Y738_9SPHI
MSAAQRVQIINQNKSVSIRGLSVVDDKIAWISSSQGYIANTLDGGNTWKWRQVKGFEKADFRDIEAFSAKEAIILSSGTPAMILKTTDGGNTWKVKYSQNDSTYFLDAMDFDKPNHGFVMGDPIKNKFLLLETKNGGNNWQSIDGPDAINSQAAFAASGTCLILKATPTVVTGGGAAEVISKNHSVWQHTSLPITHGQNSRGAFSISGDRKRLVVVGGDYINNKRRDSTVCYSINSGQIWLSANSFPSGYQSCVEYIEATTFLSTGTAGTNISMDGGKNWTQIDGQSFNVCRKAKRGKLVLLAGDSGKIGIFKK